MTDTTDRAQWCPRCGGEMVRLVSATSQDEYGELFSRAGYAVGCEDCGFGADNRIPIQPVLRGAQRIARSLIRAELARQALDMWTRMDADVAYDSAQRYVLKAYEWLGTHPLRLPGEGA